MNDDETFTITLDDDVTINLDSISTNIGTYSVDSGTFSISDITISSTDTIDTGYINTGSSGEVYNILDKFIDPDQVEEMCKEYPALSKVWRNFKSVYDMTLQDYKGKKEQDKI